MFGRLFFVFLAVVFSIVSHSQRKADITTPTRLSSSTLLSIANQVNLLIKRFKRVTNRKRKAKAIPPTVFLLCLLLLALSHDVESNPGPVHADNYLEGNSTVFPCGNCQMPVTWSCKGLQCDMCMVWYHADCQNITNSLYDILGDSLAGTAVWKCSVCEDINVTNRSIPSLDSFETSNIYANLDSSNLSDLSFSGAHTSTPKRHHPTKEHQSRSKKGKRNNIRRSLKVHVVNCRSIVDKKLEFSNLVNSSKPDIVLGTESWLKPKHLTSEVFDVDLGYTIFRRDRIKKAGGGVFIAIRNCFIAQEIPELQSECEDLWVKLDLVGNKPLVIGAYYKPLEGDENSFTEFSKSLEKVTKKYTNIWVAGDLNLPKMDWDTSSPSPDCKHPNFYRQIIETFNDANLTQMVNLPTRDNNILDLFLTTNPTLVNQVSILPGISDHNIVETKVNTSARICYQKPRKIPLYKKANWQEIKKSLIDYHQVMKNEGKYTALNTEELWENFSNTLQELTEKWIPSKQSSVRNHLPWVNQDIKKLIRRRNRAFKRVKNTSSSSDRKKFLDLKHLVRKKVKEAHTQYLESILNINTDAPVQHKPNTKKLFSLIKHSRQESSAIPPLKYENKVHQDDLDKATVLNKQFQSVFSPKSPPSPDLVNKMNSDPGGKPVPTMPDIKIGKAGVEKLLDNLNPHKACGPDKIKPMILKTLSAELSPILEVIFQKSLEEGSLPSQWKSAYVAPIFKKGDRSQPVNYRPISLTCVLCKVLEHIVSSSMVKHFTNHGILYDLQHGFREKRSCVTQLVMLVNDLVNTVYNKNQVDLVLLDFSKAFDKVNHEKVLLKIQHYGVRGNTLRWVKNFLENRSQSVVLNGTTSDAIPVTSGVPQGSVLGPLLFLAYINDLPQNVRSKVRLFADDTAIYLSLTSADQSVTLQNDLNTLEKWELEWDMEFNPSKCQVIHVTRRKHPFPTHYTLHGVQLESVSSAKYLGVDISNDLSWDNHINRSTTKANQTLGFLRRNIKVKSEPIKSIAYQTLVRPQLEYASEVWSPNTQTHINQIEMVQRRAARWIKADYSRTSSVTDMLHSLNLRRLDLRRIDARLSLFYKIHYNLVAIPIEDYLTPMTRYVRYGHSLSYRLITATTDYYKFSYFPRTVYHWNQLPPTFVHLPTLEQFNAAVCRIEHDSP